MKIDLVIYNRILYRDLRPWLKENQSEAKFKKILSPSFKFPEGGPDAISKAINHALKDHPILLVDSDYEFEFGEDKVKVTSIKDNFFEPLIEIDITPPINHKTEFYYYLIRNEGIRFTNKFNEAVQLCNNESEAKFLVNSTLIKVQTLLKETGKLLNELSYSDKLRFDELPKDKTEAQRKMTDYILTAQKTTLIRLLLEMQETYEAFISSKILTEDEIYITILGQTPPSEAVRQITEQLNSKKIKRYIISGEYSKEKTLELINDTREIIAEYYSHDTIFKETATRKAALAENIHALENLYFVREFGFADANPNYDTLISDEYNEKIFSQANQAIAENIEAHSLPNKRLAVITKEEQRLSFLQAKIQIDESVLPLSIPRRILLMLSGNKAYTNANLQIDFSKISDTANKPLKTNISVGDLALLFRMLADLKPDVIDEKVKADIFRFISASFTTKKSKEGAISTDKISKLFNNPDPKSVDFWKKHLHTMSTFLKNS